MLLGFWHPTLGAVDVTEEDWDEGAVRLCAMSLFGAKRVPAKVWFACSDAGPSDYLGVFSLDGRAVHELTLAQIERFCTDWVQ